MTEPKALSEFMLTDAHLKAIGLITAEWSRLESSIEMLMWQLAELKIKQGQAITTHMSFPLKIDVLRTLCHEAFDGSSTHEEIKAIIIRIKASKVIRDRIAHANWFLLDEASDVSATRTTARGKLAYIAEEMSINDLEEVTTNITALIHDLSDFLGKYLLSPLAYLSTR